MNLAVLLFALPALSVLPGVWLAFGLPIDELGDRVRLALAVALSPAVIGVQYAALKALGISVDTAALLVLVINLPSLWLLRRLRPSLLWLPAWSRRNWAAAVILAGGLVLVLVVPWLLIDGLRTFSWHALLHTDIIYQLSGPAIRPEEPELGGVALAFAWMPHAYWVVLGVLADVAPTRLYPVSNILWLLVCVYLIYALAAGALRLRPSSALFCGALALLGTQAAAYVARLLTNDRWFAADYFGFRLSTIVQKFRGFETMPFAFALFLAVLLIVVWRLRAPLGAAGAIEGSLLLALGIVYPILMPVALLVAGSQVLLILTRWSRDLRPFARREIVQLILGVGLAAVAFVPVYYFYTQGTQGPSLLSLAGRQTKTWQTLLALLPFGLLALPAAVQAVRRREGVTMLLLWSAACSALLHIVVNLAGLEYKYVLTASLLLAPVCALTVDRFSLRFPAWEWLPALGVPVLLLSIEFAWTLGMYGHIPSNLVNAPQVNEEHFWLRLDPGEPDAAWVQAINERTPPATLLVATQAKIHLGPFARRALYVSSDADGAAASGYSMDNRSTLVGHRRYPAQVYDTRLDTVAHFMSSDQPAQLEQALATMLAQQRPLAIHFADSATPALRWLQAAGIGEQLYSDGQQTVWYIEPGAALVRATDS
jgi:hypothetical protein